MEGEGADLIKFEKVSNMPYPLSKGTIIIKTYSFIFITQMSLVFPHYIIKIYN